MEYEEFRRHLGKAGLNVNGFASLIDVSPSAISNYSKKGSVPRHYAVLAVLLGDAVENKVDFRALLARFGVSSGSTDRKITRIQDYRARSPRRAK